MRMQAASEAREYRSLNMALHLCGMSKRAWYYACRPR